MVGNVAKAASGLLLRAGRMLALAAMAAAVWPLAGRILALLSVERPGVSGLSAGMWCIAVAIASASCVAAMTPPGGDGSGWRRELAGKLPFALWACLTWDGRVTAWRALLWALLWPAEMLVCLFAACWWLAAAAWAAMDFTLYRRGGR